MNCTDRFHDDPRNAPLGTDGVPAGVIFCALLVWAGLIVLGLRGWAA